jgi:hypothetical protein
LVRTGKPPDSGERAADLKQQGIYDSELLRLFLRIRHVRKIERLASLRHRDPRIPQAGIVFALQGIVCFLGQRCAFRRRFPRDLALGSHLVVHFDYLAPRSTILRPPRSCCESCVSHFSLRKKASRRMAHAGERETGIVFFGSPEKARPRDIRLELGGAPSSATPGPLWGRADQSALQTP